MKLTSPEFENHGKIPPKFTCEGENTNPMLQIEEVPRNASSLVLIMDDPDVPLYLRKDGMYVHWVLYDLPADLETIPEGFSPAGKVGKGTSGDVKYFGPCPPDREHRYFFKLYALDRFLHLPPGATKEEVERAMKGHILAHTELLGLYKKMHM